MTLNQSVGSQHQTNKSALLYFLKGLALAQLTNTVCLEFACFPCGFTLGTQVSSHRPRHSVLANWHSHVTDCVCVCMYVL